MFIADVVAVDVDEAYMDEKDTFHLSMAKPLAYSHGRYYGMGEELGSFGYSVRKQEKGAKAGRKTSKSAEKAEGAGKVRKSADVNGGKKAERRIVRNPTVRGMIRRDRSSLQSDCSHTEQLTRDNYSDRQKSEA